jgi:predicted DCC family thiol-disulfide oxidoreductase YuxK
VHGDRPAREKRIFHEPMEGFVSDAPRDLTVYFDGSCPLCRAEIGHYRKRRGAETIEFVDVSNEDVPLACGLDRTAAMARFHVRESNGRLFSGAEAFTRIWARLPAWRWASRLTALPGVTPALEIGYRAFLPIRPALSRALRRFQARG